MKRIITLSLLLCTNSNITLASDTYTTPNNTRTTPISYEIAINNLQTSISRLEIRSARLAGVDRLKTYWASFSLALLAIACISIDTSSYISTDGFAAIRLLSAEIGFFSGIILAWLLTIRSSMKRDIISLQQQIDQLIAKSQQECNTMKE